METVNDQLKNISEIEHTRHRSSTIFSLKQRCFEPIFEFTWGLVIKVNFLGNASELLSPIVVYGI
ncbi:MAG: hypothetical protein FJZ59_06840 [Chlamydiae bacterium]|nr:hypothetical protein [Chlamydiota bacterium]